MRLDERPLVGDARARSVAGRSAGADTLVLGVDPASDLLETLGQLGLSPARPDAPRQAVPEVLAAVAAVAAASDGRPLVLAASDVRVSPVALLDVLDAPRDATLLPTVDAPLTDLRGAGEAGVGEPAEPAPVPAAGGFRPVRVDRHTRLVVSAGSAVHAVSAPSAFAAGVLRVAAADRAAVAEALTDAAASPAAAEPGASAFDLAVVAVVRAARVDVVAVPLAHVTVERGHELRRGAPGSAWQQRLRAASRGNDGVFSTHAIRPLSRRLTAVGLRHGWSPNVVTGASLALGLAACALTAVDSWWTWLLAAVLLQASLVVDCVDGELARFTRRYSALGGWLDAVSDRVKEFTMVAAVAWVAARRGEDLWWLAVLVLAVLAVRHVEDFAYSTRQRASGTVERAPHPFEDHRDGGPDTAPTSVAAPPAGRARVARDAKQVLHLPIAERYLLMSLGLLLHRPAVLLWVLGIASVVALAWTQSGRLLRALTRRDGFRPDRPDGTLAHLTDLAVLPRPTGRGRFAWQVPALLVAVETAALLLAAGADPTARAAAYAWLAVVCWHLYDNVYRLRETGSGSPRALVRATLGVEGRVVLLGLVGGLSAHPAPLLLAGAVVLAVLFGGESARAWRRHLRGTRQDGRS
ncbi:DUF5941 domain-containing protein [Intrasporangium flavum]|uniref:DUF5941 domain-containing protein n=1 Tax=Intrasporangium flavum TaxID=1428657 RepID=UPI00096E1DBC|nr:DUF5941 domain-containing protein [Intrasporangium flavum]